MNKLNLRNRLKTIWMRLKGLSKKQMAFVVIGILILGWGAFAAIGGGAEPIIVLAEKGTIEEEVLATGKTESRSEVHLGFVRSGQVVSSGVSVGSRVYEGQTLARLDSEDLRASRAKAVANLNEELVRLDSTKRSSTLTYESAEANARRAIEEAYAAANEAVKKNADFFFQSPTTNPRFAVYSSDNAISYIIDSAISFNTKTTLENGRKNTEEVLNEFARVAQSARTTSDLSTAFSQTETYLVKVKKFMSDLAWAVSSLSAYYNPSYETTIQSYKDSLASARADVAAAETNLQKAKDAFENAESPRGQGEMNYSDVLAGEARVASLRAELQSIDADINKTVIRSPIAGVVTEHEAKVGEIVTAGTPLITVISDNNLQIEANVSEVNIGKVLENNPVTIEFDAISGEEYEGVIVYIDPAATMVDGVATYKVTVGFKDKKKVVEDVRIRSGLTANLRIKTKSIENALKVPAYAVEKRSEGQFVKIMTQEGIEEREVTIGLRGKDGSLEILSGIEVGQQVIITK